MTFRNVSNLTCVAGFVRRSAKFSAEGTCWISIRLSLYFSRMKWNLMSMCFDLSCVIGFFTREIEPLLSPWSSIGSVHDNPKSFTSFVKNNDSWVVAASAIYSASHVDSAIVGCFLLSHDIAPPALLRKNTYPVVLLRSVDDAQSESENPSSFRPFSDFLYTNLSRH